MTGRRVSFVALAVIVGFLLSSGSGVAVPGSGIGEVMAVASEGDSSWQGTWYTFVNTGSGPSCTGVLGSDQWSSTFAKDWGSGAVFGTSSDNVCFTAQITIYVRQSGAYRFDLTNVDDGARLYDANGNLLFEAVCGFLSCPVQNGKDVNLQQGKSQLSLQYWEISGVASISFLSTDKSIFRNAAPVVSFTYSPSAIRVGVPVSFSDSSVDPDGDAVTRLWDIGGASYSQSSPTHTFAAAGSYPVTLTVTDEFGASATKTMTVSVSEAPPSGIGGAGFGGNVFYIPVALAALVVVGAAAVLALRMRKKRSLPPVK